MKKWFLIGFTLVFTLFFAEQALAQEGLIRYTVKKGDSFSRLAQRYHQPLELLTVVNNMDANDTLKIGEKILIPVDPATESVVLQKGDNPWDIAKKYGISTKKLLAANEIENAKRLMPGDILSVPVAQMEEEPDLVIAVKKSYVKKREPRMKLSYRQETQFIWPVTGPISSAYGTRWGNEFHHGLDIAADYGTPIVAAQAGRVILAGYKNSIYGNTVMIDGGTYTLLYAHMSKISVDDGQEVSQGEQIGRVGDSGRTTGPHLHLEVRSGNDTLNPIRFLP